MLRKADFEVIYSSVSPSDSEERMDRAFKLIFDKIEQMETRNLSKEIERKESYGDRQLQNI